jgi:hypothetical protein
MELKRSFTSRLTILGRLQSSMRALAVLAFWFAAPLFAADLQPVFRLTSQRLITSNQFGFEKAKAEIDRTAFRAVLTNQWLPGLVPLFAIERQDRFELRRLPPGGQANITEPFCFALPPNEEPHAALIAGRWRCLAKRADETTVYPDFEIASHGTNISARFDQGSEYRFAFIVGGSFVGDRLELRIEYIADHYEMTAQLQAGKLAGQWRHLNGTERASWTAERDLPGFEPPRNVPTADLYEWRESSGGIQYLLQGESLEGGTRAKQPLARVWLP